LKIRAADDFCGYSSGRHQGTPDPRFADATPAWAVDASLTQQLAACHHHRGSMLLPRHPTVVFSKSISCIKSMN